MQTKIKICGLTRIEDIIAVNKAKPDYIGFVFAESKRKVDMMQARKLQRELHNEIKCVGVFASEQIKSLLATLKFPVLDMIQLHGGEDEKYIKQLKEYTNLPIIKAVSIQKKGDAQAWENSAADFLLLDHKGGGTGETFDWNLIGEVTKPFFLAGGLSSQNVARAIKKIAPYAVDTSSGVEISPAKKCPKRITNFCECARQKV
jgi:phosphoribosylanthranilate isomerase